MASDQHTSCDEIRPLVREATRGGLDNATRERVYGHIAGCATCRSVAEEERDLDRLLEQQLPRYAAPLALKRRLEARLPGAGEPPPPPRRRAALRWAAPGLAGAAVAAALVLVGLRGPTHPQGEP